MHTRSEQGFTWDAGAQFMMGGYRYMRRLMEKLALPVSQHKVPSVTATMLPDGRLYYTRTGSPGGILRHPALSFRSRAKMGKVMLEGWRNRRLFDWYHPEKAAPIDTESLRESGRPGNREGGTQSTGCSVLQLPRSSSGIPTRRRGGSQYPWRGRWPEANGASWSLREEWAPFRRPLPGISRSGSSTGPPPAEFEPGGHVRLAGEARRDGRRRGGSVVLATPAPVTLALLQNPDEALGFEEAICCARPLHFDLTTAWLHGPPEGRRTG